MTVVHLLLSVLHHNNVVVAYASRLLIILPLYTPLGQWKKSVFLMLLVKKFTEVEDGQKRGCRIGHNSLVVTCCVRVL
jgi:hypothetical protein